MSFEITFKAKKSSKPANENVHDEAMWAFSHEWAETTYPVRHWPRQYAVHYLYEMLNRPWLSHRDRCNLTLACTFRHHENMLANT